MSVGDLESHHQIGPGVVRQQEESESRPRGPGGAGPKRVARKGQWQDRRKAVAPGWHHAHTLRLQRRRATPEHHGYMMCLDEGESREGVMLRLPDDDLAGQLRALRRSDRVKALIFHAAPAQLDFYSAKRPHSEIAHALARACAHWGTGAEHLRNSVVHLEETGFDDPHLRRLQEMVAEEIPPLPLGLSKRGKISGVRTAVIGSGRTMPKGNGK